MDLYGLDARDFGHSLSEPKWISITSPVHLKEIGRRKVGRKEGEAFGTKTNNAKSKFKCVECRWYRLLDGRSRHENAFMHWTQLDSRRKDVWSNDEKQKTREMKSYNEKNEQRC